MRIEEIIEKGSKHPCKPKNAEDADRFVCLAREDHGGEWDWRWENGEIAVYAYFPEDEES